MHDTIHYFKDIGVEVFSTCIARDNIWSNEKINEYEKIINESIDFYIEEFPKCGIINKYMMFPIIERYYRRNNFCPAGTTLLGVSTNGDIYPCARFINNRSPYKMGNIKDGMNINSPIYHTLKNMNIDNITKCKNCPIHPGCMGQCMASSYESLGSIFKPIECVCEINKINYNASFKLYNSLKNNEDFMRIISNIIGLSST